MTACVFCDRISRGECATTSDPDVVSFTPLNPVTTGHRLFVPRFHVGDFRTAASVLGYTMAAAARAVGPLRDANLIVSAGPDATQTIRHLHVHLVPRLENDGLHLPWTGQQA